MTEIDFAKSPGDPDSPEVEPFLRVERGVPGRDEIAALVVVLAALAAQDAGAAPGLAGMARPAWNDPAEMLRQRRYPQQLR
jgi:hypothetical protein